MYCLLILFSVWWSHISLLLAVAAMHGWEGKLTLNTEIVINTFLSRTLERSWSAHLLSLFFKDSTYFPGCSWTCACGSAEVSHSTIQLTVIINGRCIDSCLWLSAIHTDCVQPMIWQIAHGNFSLRPLYLCLSLCHRSSRGLTARVLTLSWVWSAFLWHVGMSR